MPSSACKKKNNIYLYLYIIILFTIRFNFSMIPSILYFNVTPHNLYSIPTRRSSDLVYRHGVKRKGEEKESKEIAPQWSTLPQPCGCSTMDALLFHFQVRDEIGRAHV